MLTHATPHLAGLVACVAFILTLLLVPLVRRVALQLKFVDRPGGRHSHTTPTALGGGAAIFLSVWVALALAWRLTGQTWDARLAGIFTGSVLLFILSLADDAWGLPVLPRFMGQILVALIAWMRGVSITGVNSLLVGHMPTGWQHWVSAPLTVLWIVFLINAVNWIDGLDGLAAGVIGLGSVTLSLMGFHSGNLVVGAATAALAASCFAFLFFNFNPAQIFMGDSGAMFLGYMVACFSILGAFKSTALVAMAGPVLVLGIPIYDVISTMLGRLVRGQPVYTSDRSHFHHRLLDKGLSVRQTVLVIYGMTAVLCLIALGLWWR
jgi:UDP-GlcNAc:undecaprenyl-phosphate GlcNAc-1-phosphate transferase